MLSQGRCVKGFVETTRLCRSSERNRYSFDAGDRERETATKSVNFTQSVGHDIAFKLFVLSG